MALMLHSSRIAPWSALIAGMAAQALHQNFLADVLRYDCTVGNPVTGVITGALALLLIAAGSWISWSSVRDVHVAGPHEATRRFIARLSLMVGALFAIGVLWQVLATMLVPACPQ
jgi:hypothetical protein